MPTPLVAPSEVDVQMPADADRQVVLADLVVLRHVRIEVVLPVEQRVRRDLAVEREADLHDRRDRLAVRERAAIPDVRGRPGQTLVLGSSPNSLRQPQNIFVRVESSTWHSNPMTVSSRPWRGAAYRTLRRGRSGPARILDACPGSRPLHLGRARAPTSRRDLGGAGSVYVIWSTTYLAIKVVNETLPTLLARRDALPGGRRRALRDRDRRRDAGDRPTGRPTGGRRSSWAGLFVCGNGAVVLAERNVPSGIAALVIALVPLWIAVGIGSPTTGSRRSRSASCSGSWAPRSSCRARLADVPITGRCSRSRRRSPGRAVRSSPAARRSPVVRSSAPGCRCSSPASSSRRGARGRRVRPLDRPRRSPRPRSSRSPT